MHNEILHSLTLTTEDQSESYKLPIVIEINNDVNLWKTYSVFLSEKELEYLAQKITPEAKNSFCLGRISAKKALSNFSNSSFKEMSIETGTFGFPLNKPNTTGTSISIGHTKHAGISISYEEELICGIDIEFLDSKKDSIIESILSEKELQLKSDLKSIDNSSLLHYLWAAKEALSKSIKTGFLIPMNLFEVSELSIINNNLHIVFFKNFPFMKSIVFNYKKYVISIAIPSKLNVKLS